ncbi:hypothetical protein [Fibrella aquatilis]|uniref:Lipoprotein n=1 Tax=Fibrella aquatilis TaxID=2817059 RepID=A0A939GB29_9BACT|nr:hypothetical protein [Fibrella aquatilis]MBO0933108.1 hypothetical protein [Fibrella aquatilis]
MQKNLFHYILFLSIILMLGCRKSDPQAVSNCVGIDINAKVNPYTDAIAKWYKQQNAENCQQLIYAYSSYMDVAKKCNIYTQFQVDSVEKARTIIWGTDCK